jgi:translation initiation factor 1
MLHALLECSPSPTVLTDPFADAESENESNHYIHVRVQQRNGRKSLTTVQGIDTSFDYKKVLKAFKKEFCCNGTVVEDTELGNVRSP